MVRKVADMLISDISDSDVEKSPIISQKSCQTEKGEREGNVQSETKGLSVGMTAMFIVGHVAGFGLLTIPKALDNGGVFNLLFIFVASLTLTYTGKIVGRSWVVVSERYPDLKGDVRRPYSTIGQVTYGTPGRQLVSISINLSMYGAAIISLLVSAENVQELASDIGLQLPFVGWTLLAAVIVSPVTLFGTPKDFWFVAVGVTLATAISCVVLLVNIIYDGVRQTAASVYHTPPTFLTACVSFGPVFYGIGGHAVFSTLQNDMKDQRQFGHAVYWAYSVVLSMYLSVSGAAYWVYGSALRDNLLLTVSHGPMLYTVQVLMTLHLLFSLVIAINPVFLDIEDRAGIPKHFTWKRCCSRITMMALAVVIGLSVPSFGVIVSLVGGSAMALLTVVCPLVFYLKLSAMDGDWEDINISATTKILQYIMIGGGIVAGSLCTFSTIATLVTQSHQEDFINRSSQSNATDFTVL